MSHRKFEHPRHGNLAFLPRKRCRRVRGRVRSFPTDKPTANPFLTGFIGFKAGMTHITRQVDRQGSKLKGRDVVEPVTIVEAPPMHGIGLIGYKETQHGLKQVGTYWASTISDEVKRRYYKNWFRSNQAAFSKTHSDEEQAALLAKLTEESHVVRLIAHTDQAALKKPALRMKKAHIMEIQINGGRTIGQKFDFAKGFLEQPIPITSVFNKDEQIDIVAISTGHGFEGVIHRWGVSRLPRKSHRGLRKVGCIGAWHPARVRFTVARPGQNGFHHRTELNKKVYHIGDELEKNAANAKTDFDHTEKSINPMGGFPWYGEVTQQYLILKGSIPGPVKRAITLRKPITKQTSRAAQEEIKLKTIDTSSKIGHGKFQTSEERARFMGTMKKDRYEASKK